MRSLIHACYCCTFWNVAVCRPAACSCFGPFKSVPVCLVFVSVEKSLSSLMSDKSVTPLQQMVVKMLHFFPCEKKRFIFLSKWSVKGVVGVIVEWLCEPQPHRKCVTKTLQTSDLTEIYRCAQRLEKVRKDCRYSRNSYSYIIKINTNLTVMWPQLWEATMNPFTMEQMFHHDNWYDDETMSGGLRDARHRVKVKLQRALGSLLFCHTVMSWFRIL